MLLQKRSPQTSAICLSEYAWLDNGRQQTPCLVAAYALAACAGGTWIIDGLSDNHHYDLPNSTTANACSCSWAAYNLLSGCTACQGQEDDIQNWSPYIAQCPQDAQSDKYWPQHIEFPDESAIPYWATQNPMEWPRARFDVDAAQTLASEAPPDPPPTSPERDPPNVAGMVAGGVIGGIALLIAIVVVYFIIKKRRGGKLSRQSSVHSQPPFQVKRKHEHSASTLPFILSSSRADVSNPLGYALVGTSSPLCATDYITTPFTGHNNGNEGSTADPAALRQTDHGLSPIDPFTAQSGTAGQTASPSKVRPSEGTFHQPDAPPDGGASLYTSIVASWVPRRYNPPPYSPGGRTATQPTASSSTRPSGDNTPQSKSNQATLGEGSTPIEAMANISGGTSGEGSGEAGAISYESWRVEVGGTIQTGATENPQPPPQPVVTSGRLAHVTNPDPPRSPSLTSM
ncbi:hypothetical protein AX16_009360 [Volvariella volvacea WC 439]|nr:hypothetical protein AX16_009360 [Volvariella volvacea WC 439]